MMMPQHDFFNDSNVFKKWLYETEYSRNFTPTAPHSSDGHPNSINYASKDFKEKIQSKQHVGTQADESKNLKSILKKETNKVTQRPSSAPAVTNTIRDESKNTDEEKHQNSQRNFSKLKSQEKQEEPYSSKNMVEYKKNTEKDVRTYANIFNMVAGMNSSEYKRAPFIQSKKKVEHVGENVRLGLDFHKQLMYENYVAQQHEPAMQKRRITCYSKNHNILRTRTIDEPEYQSNTIIPNPKNTETGMNDNKEIDIALRKYHEYRVKSIPSYYKTSYNDDFNADNSLVYSPLELAEKRLELKNKTWRSQHDWITDDSLKNYKNKTYNKTNYETEYEKSYQSSKGTDQNLETGIDSRDEFYDYYEKVLQNREIAYHPVLENYSNQFKSDQNKKRKPKQRRAYDPAQYTDR